MTLEEERHILTIGAVAAGVVPPTKDNLRACAEALRAVSPAPQAVKPTKESPKKHHKPLKTIKT